MICKVKFVARKLPSEMPGHAIEFEARHIGLRELYDLRASLDSDANFDTVSSEVHELKTNVGHKIDDEALACNLRAFELSVHRTVLVPAKSLNQFVTWDWEMNEAWERDKAAKGEAWQKRHKIDKQGILDAWSEQGSPEMWFPYGEEEAQESGFRKTGVG